jgi:hypothetical protein
MLWLRRTAATLVIWQPIKDIHLLSRLLLLGSAILLLVSCAPASLDEYELLDRIIEIERTAGCLTLTSKHL